MTKTYKYRISATVKGPHGVRHDVTLHAMDQFEIASAAFRSAEGWLGRVEKFSGQHVSYSDIKVTIESEITKD